MTATLRRTVIVTMAALGVAFLLAWAASTGPTGVVGDARPTTAQPSSAPTTASDRTDRPVEDQGDGQHDDSLLGTGSGQWLHDGLGLLAILAALWFLGLVVRFLVEVVGPRLPAEQLVLDLDPRADVEAGREAVAADRDRHREALTVADVRNGIVACWVLLEESAAAAGVVRRPAETATEFVVRFLHTLDVDPRPVGRLAELYHEARFSSHAMDTGARSGAERALEAIHDEIALALRGSSRNARHDGAPL